MADKIRGITIELNGDTSGLSDSLKAVNKDIGDTQKGLKDVEKLLRLDPSNVTLLEQKQKLLNRAITDSRTKLQELQKTQASWDAAGVDKNSDSYLALQREIEACRLELDRLERQSIQTGSALTKIAQVNAKVGESAQAIAKATDGLAKASGVALAAVAGVGTAAIKAYAEYETLSNGVDKLYGASAATLRAYADEAYKTAGMSANAYLTASTSFAASLVSSLGGNTAQAVEIANMAITDMSDNVSALGTTQESLNAAYQGFAKQNYTLLDNLKLGYGGTKTEMERLLADAEKLSGIHYDIGNLSDVYSAIHVIQQELKVTGSTAKATQTTITGSVTALKSAINNLVTGLGRADADTKQLTQNVVDAAETVKGNLLPVVDTLLDNIGTGGKVVLGLAAGTVAVNKTAQAISSISTIINTAIPIIAAFNTATAGIGGPVAVAALAIGGLTVAVKNLADEEARAEENQLKAMQAAISYEDAVATLNAVTDEQMAKVQRMSEIEYQLAHEYDSTGQTMAELRAEYDALLAEGLAPLASQIKVCTAVVEAHDKAEEGLTEAIEDNTEALAENVEGNEDVQEAVEKTEDYISDIIKAYNDAASSARSSIDRQISAFSDYSSKISGTAYKAKDLLSQMSDNTNALADYTANLKEAARLGLDEGLIASLSDGSAESAAQLAAIIASLQEGENGLTEFGKSAEESVDVWNSAWSSRESALDTLTDEIAKITAIASSSGAGLYEEAWRMGGDFSQGFINGMLAKQKNVAAAGTSIGKTAANSAKTAVNIGSPSKLMYQYGEWMDEGFANGMLDNLKGIEGAATQMAEAAIPMQMAPTQNYSSTTNNNRSVSFGAVNLVVNAAPGQDVEAIADAVMDKIQFAAESKEAAIA